MTAREASVYKKEKCSLYAKLHCKLFKNMQIQKKVIYLVLPANIWDWDT